jgi:hypothetical protein
MIAVTIRQAAMVNMDVVRFMGLASFERESETCHAGGEIGRHEGLIHAVV